MKTQDNDWTAICEAGDILPNLGICALVKDRHVAVFRLQDEQYFAIDNVDPKSGASVLSRVTWTCTLTTPLPARTGRTQFRPSGAPASPAPRSDSA